VPSTYTRHATRTRELEDRIYGTIAGFLRDPKQGQPLRFSIASLWRQHSRLAAENVELRAMLGGLEQLLIEKGIASEEEIRDRVHGLGLFEGGGETSSDEIARWLEQMVAESEAEAAEADSMNLDQPIEP
jgi:hypothetical protein